MALTFAEQRPPHLMFTLAFVLVAVALLLSWIFRIS